MPTYGTPRRGLLFTSGSVSGLEARQRLQLARRDLVRADVVDHLGEIAQAAFAVDHARLLIAGLAIPAQLHIVIPPSIE
jgi:hypothetical protein